MGSSDSNSRTHKKDNNSRIQKKEISSLFYGIFYGLFISYGLLIFLLYGLLIFVGKVVVFMFLLNCKQNHIRQKCANLLPTDALCSHFMLNYVSYTCRAIESS